MAPQPLVRTFPNEVWDNIADFVEDPVTLLRLCQTCYGLNSILWEDHLQCCAITTLYDAKILWETLGSYRNRGRRVRSLAVLDDECSAAHRRECTLKEHHPSNRTFKTRRTFPSIRESKTCPLNEVTIPLWPRRLEQALRRMTTLKKLSFCMETCQFSRLQTLNTALAPSIEDLEIHLLPCSLHGPAAINDCVEILNGLRGGYTTFAFASAFPRSSDSRKVLDAISAVIGSRCPDLHSLEIRLVLQDSHATANDIPGRHLWDASWPHLRLLSLHGIGVGFGPLPTFIDRHAEVEDFSCSHSCDLMHMIGLESFPNLRRLETDQLGLSGAAFLFRPLHIYDVPYSDTHYRPIETLALRLDPTDSAPFDEMDMILHHAASAGVLRKLTYLFPPTDDDDCLSQHRFWLRQIGRCIPTIRELVTQVFGDHAEHMFETFSRFSNLDIIRGMPPHGIFGALAEIYSWDVSSCTDELERQCPSVRQVDDYVKGVHPDWP